MATPVREMVDFIASNFGGETVRGGFQPTDPDRVITVTEVAGDEPPAETFVGAGRGPKLNIESPNFQILCRTAPDCYEDAAELAYDVYVLLHNQVRVTLGSTSYALIEALQPPFNLGIDEDGRYSCGFNIRCWKEQTA